MTEGEVFKRLCGLVNRLEEVTRYLDESALKDALGAIVEAGDGLLDDIVDARIPGVRRRDGPMAKKTSFKVGSEARKARGNLAEKLKDQGMETDKAFAVSTAATKRMSKAGRKRAAKGAL